MFLRCLLGICSDLRLTPPFDLLSFVGLLGLLLAACFFGSSDTLLPAAAAPVPHAAATGAAGATGAAADFFFFPIKWPKPGLPACGFLALSAVRCHVRNRAQDDISINSRNNASIDQFLFVMGRLTFEPHGCRSCVQRCVQVYLEIGNSKYDTCYFRHIHHLKYINFILYVLETLCC